MIKLLVRKFIKNCEDTSNKEVRIKYTSLSGALGIICNGLLFMVKLIIGIVMGSLAIISDAFNNLSDMGSSVMSIISAHLSAMRPDKKHPFGHGRFEYISSLFISFLIISVGIELFKDSLSKIIHPTEITMSFIGIIILSLSVLVKLWMFSYNRYLSNKINSSVLKAAATDSLNDAISTSAVIISTVIGYYLNINIDGIIGAIVSALIVIVGFKLAKETIFVLLGSAPSEETVKAIEELVLSGKQVLGVHDLIVHDYGPGRMFASVHAEVSDRGNITEIHEEIDLLEQRCANELNIELVIHMDPISTNDETLTKTKSLVKNVISELGNYSIHDFRITDGENRINLIFDLVVPCEMQDRDREILVETISNKLKKIDERYYTVIHIDNDYAGVCEIEK